MANLLFLVKNQLYRTGNLILLLFINIVLEESSHFGWWLLRWVSMWCTCWLFSPMGTVLRQTYPGFLWTQKWKSINNLNFFEENFSSLMNIQAWLQLNSKVEFSECFWMHHKHDKHRPQTTCPPGRLNVEEKSSYSPIRSPHNNETTQL